VSEIGIERFGAGHRQEHGAERYQPDHAMRDEKFQTVVWVDREQYPRISNNRQ